jgi:hypothetical protein
VAGVVAHQVVAAAAAAAGSLLPVLSFNQFD